MASISKDSGESVFWALSQLIRYMFADSGLRLFVVSRCTTLSHYADSSRVWGEGWISNLRAQTKAPDLFVCDREAGC